MGSTAIATMIKMMENGEREPFTKIIDSHAHLFSPAVFASVSKRDGLADALHIHLHNACGRIDKAVLKQEAEAAGVQACLLLPTASINGVRQTNSLFLQTVEGEDCLINAGTLHPYASGIDEELEMLSGCGVRALKFCSFSQGFDLAAEATFQLFDKIRTHNTAGKPRFFAILDTFYQADRYFGVPRNHLTTPEKLGRLASRFPEIDFIGAHMGGLTAPWSEMDHYLTPQNNLYLDTSNAAHLLPRTEFLRLLTLHGPDRIIFGTDWPWFGHKEEIACIQGLLQDAGLSFQEKSKVFSGNISRLLGQ